MAMDNSFTKLYFSVVLLTALSSKTIYSQATSPPPDTSVTFGQYLGNKKSIDRIKWTWHLPASVKKAFDESEYKDWFMENITMYNSSGKTFYRFLLNNGSLLDGDHYDSLLKNDYLDVSDSGTIIRNQIPR
jgi:hypothetical protein